MKIGIISDTHGKVPAEVFDIFNGVDEIWHAGDVGGLHIIAELETIAPVFAVYGNTDGFPIRTQIPEFRKMDILQSKFLLVHEYLDQNLKRLSLGRNIDVKQFDMLVFGHTHQPVIKNENTVTYFNPGSAVLPRNGFGPSVGLITISDSGAILPEIIFLKNTSKKT